MKKLLLSLFLAATPTMAAAQPAPTPAAERTTTVQMTALDLQVALIAIANAGAACDQQVQAVCQIVQARAGTLSKLQAAFQALQTPPAPTPNP